MDFFNIYLTDIMRLVRDIWYSILNVILAFLSRSYHESVKNPNAFFLTQIGEGEKIDLTKEFLFYSRPKGVYKGKDSE